MGALFKNNRKTNEKQPDYTGNIEIDGITYQLAGWKKEKNGNVFISLKASLREKKEEVVSDDFFSEVPF